MINSIKVFIVAMVLSVSSPLMALPRIDQPVTDQTGTLASAEAVQISDLLIRYRSATTNQIALLLVDDTEGMPIQDFATDTANAWRGGLASRDNGVLIVFDMAHHRNWISTGSGLDGRLTSLECRDILANSRGYLRGREYARAFNQVIDGVIAELGGWPASSGHRTTYSHPSAYHRESSEEISFWWIVLGVFVLVVIVMFIIRWYDRRNSSYSYSGYSSGGGYSSGPSFTYTNIDLGGGHHHHDYDPPRRSYSSSSSDSSWSSGSSYDGGGGSFDGGGGGSDW